MQDPTVNVTGGYKNCTFPYSKDRVPLVTLYSVVLLVGVPSNLATVYLTLLQVCQRNVLGVYLLSLSMCDLTYLLTLPLWALYVHRNHEWPWSQLACRVTSYVFFTNMYISIFLLCCISVDRYVAMVYAVESRGMRRQSWAVLVTVAGCLAVGLTHVPVFTMAGSTQGHCFEPSQSTATVTCFNYARFTVGFLAPLVVLVLTNRAVLSSVRASASLGPRQKKHVRLLAFGVVLLFLVCFGPYHVVLLVRAVTYHFQAWLEDCHFALHVYTPYIISLGLSTMNSAVNPILYVLSSENIRRDIPCCLAGPQGWTSPPGHFRDSSQDKTLDFNTSLHLIPTQDQDNIPAADPRSSQTVCF
ncbi:putative G-protein coupled receptor 132b [Brachyhypopomus gauderio]|uniref:putative G-protein coupled receptor 132b n=1 Tax=Brachyhypopomus gauderio TaxID=698409 RepID=UPI004041B3D5